MLKRKRTPDKAETPRRQLTLTGVAIVLGIKKQVAYRRRREGTLGIEHIPKRETRSGMLYDMQSIFQMAAPEADENTIALLMYGFTQEHGGMVK